MKENCEKIYLVGGAVRDELLGRPVQERDWVVVGSNPETMIKRGFKPVGANFPVFIHPKTGEEYALARTERKQGHGYHGFIFNSSPEVSLEEDLSRRDLTINAIARAADGTLHDPFQGLADLNAKILRHVSPSFSEDPLRVLRVARFAARYHRLGFSIASETLELMRHIVETGEISHLTPERIWKETERALGEPSPQVYIEVLRQCGALKVLLPEVDTLFGIPQTALYHPEIDTGLHILMSLEVAAQLTEDSSIRFAVLLHDLGKGITPTDILPRHIGHEERGIPLIKAVCARLKVPNHFRELALMVGAYHLLCHRALQLRGSTLHRLFSSLDLWRRPERFEAFLTACMADARGRGGLQEKAYPSADYLRQAFTQVSQLDLSHLQLSGFTGMAYGHAIRTAQIEFLENFRKQHGD